MSGRADGGALGALVAVIIGGLVLYRISQPAFFISLAVIVVGGFIVLAIWSSKQDKAEKARRAKVEEEILKQKTLEKEVRPMINTTFSSATELPIDMDAEITAGGSTNPGYPKDWNERRQRVLLRDGYQCVLCGSQLSLTTGHIHHVVRKSVSKDHDYKNLVSLCKACHTIMDGHEIMSQPYYAINDKTKCVHTTRCKHARHVLRTATVYPSGYHGCKVCNPFESIQATSERVAAKKRRELYPTIDKHLSEVQVTEPEREISEIEEEKRSVEEQKRFVEEEARRADAQKSAAEKLLHVRKELDSIENQIRIKGEQDLTTEERVHLARMRRDEEVLRYRKKSL